jgi:hypothetical protein
MKKRILWVLFAILFYQSGLAFTILVLEPNQFEGGFQWVLALLFPFLFPTFFIVNRHLGCASGSCHTGQCDTAISSIKSLNEHKT